MSAKSRYKPVEPCKQAVIFARVSSERQEKGESIQAQLTTVHEYCQKRGLTILQPEFVITESSSRGDRKQYHEMLSFVEKQKHKTAIVVNCVDRLQRSYKDTPKLDDLRHAGKIEVHFLKENLILHKDSPQSDLVFWNLHVLMANSYILSLSDNVKRSLKYNRNLGKWQGNAPIGYLNTRDENDKATVTIDPVRGPIIRKLFEEYATGLHSLNSIIKKSVDSILDISAHIPELMAKATPTQKREFLSLILTDCTVSGQRLNYKLRKPFDKFLNSNKPSDWKSIAEGDIGDIENVKYNVAKVSEQLN